MFFIFFNYINNTLPSNAHKSLEMLLFNDKIIYLSDQDNTVIVTTINDIDKRSTDSGIITKTKYILQRNDNQFIIFGLTNNNQFGYVIYDYNGNTLQQAKLFNSIAFNDPKSYSIKLVTENDYILSYFTGTNNFCYLYHLNLNSNSNPEGGIRYITVEKDYSLNTIECDSFDNRNIFCIYSFFQIFTKENTRLYYYLFYYSFGDLNQDITLNKNDIANNAAGSSILKIEYNNEKKFLICFVEKEINSPKIYCQYFIQKGNTLLRDKIYFIGQGTDKNSIESRYLTKNPILLRYYDYSIFIHLLARNDKAEFESIIFTSTIDFNMIIQLYIPTENAVNDKKNFLVNNNYYILLVLRETDDKLDFYIYNFAIQCDSNKDYNFEHPTNSQIDLTSTLIKNYYNMNKDVYLSFSLDSLTSLTTNDKINIGSLLNMVLIQGNTNPTIYLKYNDILRITDNYYIYHEEKLGGLYKILSTFCYFKVVNCYDSCKKCNNNIKGSIEDHQCSECLNDYNKLIIDPANNQYFNCYKNSENEVKGYYSQNGLFYKCNDSCETCNNGNSCIDCKDDYYFKEDQVNTNGVLEDICYKNTPPEYYFSSNSNFNYRNKIFTHTFKNCFPKCSTCFAGGTDTINACIDCKLGYTHYNFDPTKCTIDTNDCPNYWKLDEKNNIECIDDCPDYIIHRGNNKNQCVKDCQSYINPYSLTSNPLLFYKCEQQRYCITVSFCKLKNLQNNQNECFSNSECFDMDDDTKIDDIPDEGDLDKAKRSIRLIKYYEYKNVEFSHVSQDFVKNQINKYNVDLRNELNEINQDYLERIDFITLSKYKDFTVTIYPLDLEEYVYKNIFEIKNLCSVNFKNFFEKIKYKNYDYEILYIALIEHNNHNIPINSINYFFGKFNIIYKRLNLFENLNSKYSLSGVTINVSYPLYNYENDKIEDKYSKDLISTIKNIYSINSDFNFYDSNDKYFTDLCYPFTTNKSTDMTIEDRLKEYYIKMSFCENDCTLINVYDMDEFHNPRSLCQCKVKNDIIISDKNYSFIYENISITQKSNINALKCAKNAFSAKNVVKNYIFWVFIIIFALLLASFLIIFFFSNNLIERILKIKPSKILIKKDMNYNVIENFEKNEQEKLDKIKSMRIMEDLKLSVKNVDGYKKQVFQTCPNEQVSAPPKKKMVLISDLKQKDLNNSSKEENKTDTRIDNSLVTTFNFNKHVTFELNNKDDEDNYDDIFDENINELINNYYPNKKFLENNYLILKRKKEKEYFKNIKFALMPLNEQDYEKHINTDNEDYLDDYNPYKNQKRNIFSRFRKNMDNPYDSDIENYFNKYPCKTFPNININLNKKSFLPKKMSKFFIEESDFLGDEHFFQLNNENEKYNNANEKLEFKNYNENSNNSQKNSKNKEKLNDIYSRTESKNNRSKSKSNNLKTENNMSLNEKKSHTLFSKKSMNSEDRNLIRASINSINKLNEVNSNSNSINKNSEISIFNKDMFLNSMNDIEYYYENNNQIKTFCVNYWNYLNKRELCLYSFYNSEENIPSFIRIITFFSVSILHFTLNCLLLLAKDIHKRYIYSLENDELKEGKFVFSKEFGICFGIAVLLNVIKILVVKFIFGVLFRISKSTKEYFSPTNENLVIKEENDGRNKNKEKFMEKYRKKSLIYVGVITCLMFLFGYISVCYIGTFINTKIGILLRFIISFILSIIICLILCLIIVTCLYCGKKYKKNILITCYNYMKIIY